MSETGSADGRGEELRARVVALEAEAQGLRAKLDLLERDRAQSLAQQSSVDALSTRFAFRFSAMEEELSMLANVYVASYQLSATFKLELVLRHVHELLGQLIGSRSHAIYLVDEPSRLLVCVGAEGLAAEATGDLALDALAGSGPFGAAVASAFATGISFFAEAQRGATLAGPTACVALRIDERIVGVIVVHGLLPQKSALVPVDFELFKLLAAHAGTAIYGAALYRAARGIVPSPKDLSLPVTPIMTTTSTSNVPPQVDRNPR